MSLKRIKRSDKRGAESVTEEKFTILFKSQFSIGNNELVFHVRTLSLPVVVIVHGNQEANAAASILWDNAFAETGRIPFQIPDKIPWKNVMETLNYKWRRECQCLFNLSDGACQYLAQKLFRMVLSPNSDRLVTWAMFNRETLPNRSFTFWQWYNGVMDSCKSKYIMQHWNDKSIIGFIDKQEAQQKLLQKPNGTFLLRFSDSEIGGITIAWVNEDSQGIRHVWNLQPHTPKDLTIRGLADRVRDLEHLQYVFTYDESLASKDDLFGKYYTKSQTLPETPSDGYVKATIQVTIPKIKSLNLNDVSPTSRSNTSMNSSTSSASGVLNTHAGQSQNLHVQSTQNTQKQNISNGNGNNNSNNSTRQLQNSIHLGTHSIYSNMQQQANLSDLSNSSGHGTGNGNLLNLSRSSSRINNCKGWW